MQSVIEKKEIRAPFDGIAGIREVNPGQMVPVGAQARHTPGARSGLRRFLVAAATRLAKLTTGLESR